MTEKGNYSEKDAAELIKQVLEGVAYLHSQGLPHGAAPGGGGRFGAGVGAPHGPQKSITAQLNI